MITTARGLDISQLLSKPNIDEKGKSVWCLDGQEEVMTHRSWVSLLLIIRLLKEKSGKMPVLYAPDYFCGDTLHAISGEAEVVLYTITDGLLPDYKACKRMAKDKKPDLFLFAHYFGKCLDAAPAAIFCKNQGALLIEDGAHAFLPFKKLSVYGDFTIYSPWKSYGLPDGAILVVNKKGTMGESAAEIRNKLEDLNKKLPEFPLQTEKKWIAKKLVQKVVPNVKRNISTAGTFVKEPEYQVSDFSKRILKTVTLEEIQEIGERKKENFLFIAEHLKEKYDVFPLWDLWDGIPYALIIKTDSEEKKKKIKEELALLGTIADEWPDLPERLPDCSIAEHIKSQILMVAVHDGIRFQRIRKKLSLEEIGVEECKNLRIRKIHIHRYQKLCSVWKEALPVLQSVVYTCGKAEVQGWKNEYWEILDGEHTVGFFASLKKFGAVYRINHGPMVKERYEKEVMLLIKKHFASAGRLLFIAPAMKRTGENLKFLTSAGFIYRKSYFTTGFIDLKMSQEEIRKSLDSKWRNQLKNAEKRNLDIEFVKKNSDFETLLGIHSKDKEERNFEDSGDELTKYLFQHEGLLCIVAKNDEREIISFIMLSIHEKTATYYIGWSSSEGYKANANRLLLWSAIQKLKEIGVCWFDLGGIDLVHTNGIAEFKMGINCKLYEYVGEFIVY